ncbi:DUF3499 family protein [Falsarthrobacter nasiphocae]|uniref:DUF3499 domain-containing protein n=1 Tax=Falsarthrobacter nasiphocae TaxID=189863 RepID=A0AAE4C6M9_9MICC|nr:DUF3499 family protein [Falsarthrobacter nasiphocae]MDR6891624.1 hypothetical protein [Falsarthrobacter nasiphocae]
MIAYRHCSKIGCSEPAVSTLTYSHADQTAVLGPLSLQAEPHTYDLCLTHSDRLTAPRGWEIVRLALPAPDVDPDGLSAVVDAVAEPEEEPLEAAPVRQRSWRTPLSRPQASAADDDTVRPFRR